MLISENATRYYFFPMLVWIVCIIWACAKAKNQLVRIFAGVLLGCFMCYAVPLDWVFDNYWDYHFAQQVEQFNQIPAGQYFVFKLNPPPWTMILKKP